MKKLIALTLFCLVIPSLAIAAGDNRRQLAEELLMLNNVKAQVEQMHLQIKKMLLSQLDSLEIPEADKPKVAEVQKITTDILFEDLSWDKMKDEYIDLYASTFTAEELEGIIEFTKSPLGQKLNEKTPILMQKSMAIGQQHAQAVMPKVQAAIQDFMGEAPPAQ